MSQMGQVHIELPAAAKLFTPAVTTFAILSVAGTVTYQFATEFCMRWFVLVPALAIRGYIWQFVTYPFFFPGACGAIWLLMDVAVIVVVGSAIEREWGSKAVFLLWFLVSVICGLIYTLVNLMLKQPLPAAGSAACAYALIMVFGEVYHGRQFMLMMNVVDARVVAWLMLGMGAILCVFPPVNLVWLLGAGVGWGFFKIREKLIYSEAKNFTKSYQSEGFVDID